MKRTVQKGNILILVFIALAIVVGVISLLKSKTIQTSGPTQSPNIQQITDETRLFQEYASQDLKISFQYPKGWFIEEEYPFILVSNFIGSSLHKDILLQNNQIEVLISNFNGCHKTIEENLIDPACGEGGSTVKKNEILSKETRQTESGTFYKYIIESPNNKFTYYLLESADKVLQIEKHPDPSQFEKEFEEIVNSIKFL